MKIIFWCTISLCVQRVSCLGCRGNCCIVKPKADDKNSRPTSKIDTPPHFINLVSNENKARNGLLLTAMAWNVLYQGSPLKGTQGTPQQSQGRGGDCNRQPGSGLAALIPSKTLRITAENGRQIKTYTTSHQQEPQTLLWLIKTSAVKSWPTSPSSSPRHLPTPLPSQKAC